MLQLEHVNLMVKSIEQTLRFYRAAAPHWHIRGGGEDLWYSQPRRWIHFGDDDCYLCFNEPGYGSHRDLTSMQIGLSHFAFVTDNLQGTMNSLAAAGYRPYKDGASDPYRSNIYYQDPNGVEVEFVQYHSDQPAQRNRYEQTYTMPFYHQLML